MESDEEQNRPIYKLRPSLKVRKPSVDEAEDQDNLRSTTARRVSFAASSTVKPFVNDGENNTIWDHSYEEDIRGATGSKSETLSIKSNSDMELTCQGSSVADLNGEAIASTCVKNVTIYSAQESMQMTCIWPANIVEPSENVLQETLADMSLTCHWEEQSAPNKPIAIFEDSDPEVKYQQQVSVYNSCAMELTCQAIVEKNKENIPNLQGLSDGESMELTCYPHAVSMSKEVPSLNGDNAVHDMVMTLQDIVEKNENLGTVQEVAEKSDMMLTMQNVADESVSCLEETTYPDLFEEVAVDKHLIGKPSNLSSSLFCLASPSSAKTSTCDDTQHLLKPPSLLFNENQTMDVSSNSSMDLINNFLQNIEVKIIPYKPIDLNLEEYRLRNQVVKKTLQEAQALLHNRPFKNKVYTIPKYVSPPKTIHHQVKEKFATMENHLIHYISGEGSCHYTFFTFRKKVLVTVDLDSNKNFAVKAVKAVSQLEDQSNLPSVVYNFYAFVIDQYLLKKLEMSSLQSALGHSVDMLSLLEYVYTLADICFKALMEYNRNIGRYSTFNLYPDGTVHCRMKLFKDEWRIKFRMSSVQHFEQDSVEVTWTNLKVTREELNGIMRDIEPDVTCIHHFIEAMKRHFIALRGSADYIS